MKIYKSLLLLGIFLVLFQIINYGAVADVYNEYYRYDLSISRAWQGISEPVWEDWQVDYLKSLAKTYDTLYNKNSKNDTFVKINNKKISGRPLIIWFANKDKTVSNVRLIESSGSQAYDIYCCDVIKAASFGDFPSDIDKVFMWEGDLAVLIRYLKDQKVLPAAYKKGSPLQAGQFDPNKLDFESQ